MLLEAQDVIQSQSSRPGREWSSVGPKFQSLQDMTVSVLEAAADSYLTEAPSISFCVCQREGLLHSNSSCFALC